MDILNYIEKIQEMYGDREPRNMYNQGQLVQPNDDGSRPGYAGDARKLKKSASALARPQP